MRLDRNTTVSIGLALTLMAAAASFAIMREKVQRMGVDIAEIKQDVRALYNHVFKRTAEK